MNNNLLAEYEGHKWAMEPSRLKCFIERLAALPASESIAQISIAGVTKQLQINGNVATIPISGVLFKTVPSWVRFWGIEATGYDEIRQMLDMAIANKSISEIHLRIDSPGGYADGLVEAADAIFAARESRTVTAEIEDIGASAAYWLASQTQTISAGRNTEVGSIGVYAVYVDWSKMAADIGAKVIVVRSGEHKGMGVVGDTITENQISTVQQIIDAMAENFIQAVAAGRGMESEKVRDLATGQLWISSAARELGLIDQVSQAPGSGEARAASQSNQQNQQSENQGDTDMNENEQIEQAVASARDNERSRLANIKTACGGDLEFAIAAWEKGLSTTEAKAEYADVLASRLAEARKQNSAGAGAQGAEAMVAGETDSTGDGDFIAEARELAQTKGITMTAAMKQLRRRKPASHAAFLRQSAERGRDMYAEAV